MELQPESMDRPVAASLKATYRALLARGLEAGEAANLTAFLHGLPSAGFRWTLPEVEAIVHRRLEHAAEQRAAAGAGSHRHGPQDTDPAIDRPAQLLSVRLHARHRSASRLTHPANVPSERGSPPLRSRNRDGARLLRAPFFRIPAKVRFDTIAGSWLPKRHPDRERPVIGFLTDFGLDGGRRDLPGRDALDRARRPDRRHQPHGREVRDPRRRLPARRARSRGCPWASTSRWSIPGVGTERRPIALRTARGDVLVGPDNGLLLPAARPARRRDRGADHREPRVAAPGDELHLPRPRHLRAGGRAPGDRRAVRGRRSRGRSRDARRARRCRGARRAGRPPRDRGRLRRFVRQPPPRRRRRRARRGARRRSSRARGSQLDARGRRRPERRRGRRAGRAPSARRRRASCSCTRTRPGRWPSPSPAATPRAGSALGTGARIGIRRA